MRRYVGDSRAVLQPTGKDDAAFLRQLKRGLTDPDDVMAWYTLDVHEYEGLVEQPPGELGEKALVVSWGHQDDGSDGMVPLRCGTCDWLHYYRERVRGEDGKLKCPECLGGGTTRLFEGGESA